jgi:hypothetical protein
LLLRPSRAAAGGKTAPRPPNIPDGSSHDFGFRIAHWNVSTWANTPHEATAIVARKHPAAARWQILVYALVCVVRMSQVSDFMKRGQAALEKALLLAVKERSRALWCIGRKMGPTALPIGTRLSLLKLSAMRSATCRKSSTLQQVPKLHNRHYRKSAALPHNVET